MNHDSSQRIHHLYSIHSKNDDGKLYFSLFSLLDSSLLLTPTNYAVIVNIVPLKILCNKKTRASGIFDEIN